MHGHLSLATAVLSSNTYEPMDYYLASLNQQRRSGVHLTTAGPEPAIYDVLAPSRNVGKFSMPILLNLADSELLAAIFLDHPLFAARIREWLKVLRKKNVAVVFATQSLADIASSSIAPAIVESCPQRILLPNDRAIEPQSREAYAWFGLNERQIELISRATPKRHYYLQSARGNRLFELGLAPVALALCGASDPASQRQIDAIIADHGNGRFAEHFLAGQGLLWAKEALACFRRGS